MRRFLIPISHKQQVSLYLLHARAAVSEKSVHVIHFVETHIPHGNKTSQQNKSLIFGEDLVEG